MDGGQALHTPPACKIKEQQPKNVLNSALLCAILNLILYFRLHFNRLNNTLTIQ
jgi:hypothetical protein